MVRFMLTAFFLLAGAAAVAQEVDPARPRVKVSLSREDADLHSLKRTKGELVEFHVFVEGPMIRGVDFGMKVEGGEFIGFLPNFEDRAWSPLLIPDPYPGTICQAGTECYASPCYLGKLLVRVADPKEKVVATVIPSTFKQHALVLNCDYSTTNGLYAYPAALNAPAPAPHNVDGVEYVSKGYPDAHMSEHELDMKLEAPADTTHHEH